VGRGMTSAEFAAASGPDWPRLGGVPGDPGIVSDAARVYADQFGLDAEQLDDIAADHGWEFHDPGYGDKIKDVAERLSRGELFN